MSLFELHNARVVDHVVVHAAKVVDLQENLKGAFSELLPSIQHPRVLWLVAAFRSV